MPMIFHPDFTADMLGIPSPGSAHMSPNPHLLSSPLPAEEITTIFVVGFPEDMLEREFQNMFTFCSGFEAATLKLPSHGDDSDNIPQYKKQIIGFVKFRTRMDALQARDVLNGRKVDAERGCILKAEIAKKNLHTKRGLLNEHPNNYPQLGRLNPLLTGPLSANPALRSGVLPSPKDPLGNFDAFFMNSPIAREIMGSNNPLLSNPLPNSLPVPSVTQSYQMSQHATTFDYFSGPIASSAERSLQTSRRGSPTSSIEAATTTASVGSSQSDGARSLGSSAGDMSEMRSSFLDGPPSVAPLSISTGGAAGVSKMGGNGASRGLDSPRFGFGSIGGAGESLVDPPMSVTGATATRSQSERGFSSALYNSDTLLPNRLPSLSINTNISNVVSNANLGSPTSATMPSPSTPFATLPPGPASAGPLPGPGYRCLADQNPPCNTLYVGNLPNNANEEELRQMFSKCVGYRRLCFRQRPPNGPMCFVEFDDVTCAHQALLDLHGNPLTNSVKGGIRLSFSKNPLGIRQIGNGNNNGLTGFNNGMGMTPSPLGLMNGANGSAGAAGEMAVSC
ncbi:hypothetical protein HDU97_002537 [Phlyctochytrium planicorne]|nr:hypothetical protein HDU97_002537 [Phlyctochytrium planicorne]